MEYILDAGKAVTCVNLINKAHPCLNLYCQNCVVNFMKEKHNFEEIDIIKNKEMKHHSQEPSKEEEETPERKIQKENEEKTLKHKLWLKACENIMFVCPCC